MNFDGDTFDAELDGLRLTKQLKRVFLFLRPRMHQWFTLKQIFDGIGGGARAQSLSARLRDFRKPRFGCYTISRRRAGDPKSGLWEYAMTGGRGSWKPQRKHCSCCTCACEKCEGVAW